MGQEVGIEVSVIVPVYNSVKYLRRTLESLHSQTLQSAEFIFVVDVPTDGSEKIVEEFVRLDGRFRAVYNTRNIGVARSRNVGLSLARGRYVGFADDDDVCNCFMSEMLYEAMEHENTGCDMVFCDVSVDYNTFGEREKYEKEAGRRVPVEKMINSALLPEWAECLEISYAGTVWNKLYKMEVIKNNGIEFLDRGCFLEEDTLFNLAYWGVADKVIRLPLPLYCWNTQRVVNKLNYVAQSNVAAFANYFVVAGSLLKKCCLDKFFKRRVMSEMWSWRFYTMFRKDFLGDLRALSSLFGRELRGVDFLSLLRVYGCRGMAHELFFNGKTLLLYFLKNLWIGIYCLERRLVTWRYRFCCQFIML